ncbi:MAG: ATP-binding cassette domain-containing protein [Actinobacteria bacterium]|nr:ATP-binding cassette domain-containing protein [Actinomycetota bacterium]
MILISVNEISKHYGEGEGRVNALRKVSFEINHGEFVAIIGPSGSGKSTLLSILGAMNPPSDGILEVDGIDVYKLTQERRADFRREYLGFVFQQLQLVPYLTALENVMLPLVVTDLKNHEERAIQVLEKMGLSSKLNKLPSELSGGEQSRVAIARALVNNPPIILADEPVGSLDTKTGAEVLRLFHELHKEGQTIIMVTHNPESLENVGRIVQIKDGMIFSDSTGADFRVEPKIKSEPPVKEEIGIEKESEVRRQKTEDRKEEWEKLEGEVEKLDSKVKNEEGEIISESARTAEFRRKLEEELMELEDEVDELKTDFKKEEKEIAAEKNKEAEFRKRLERELRELEDEVKLKRGERKRRKIRKLEDIKTAKKIKPVSLRPKHHLKRNARDLD